MVNYHEPVLLKEIIDELKPYSGMTYLDATLGGGGHLFELIKQSNNDCKFMAIDRDMDSIEYVKEIFIENSYEIKNIENGVEVSKGKVKGYLKNLNFNNFFKLDEFDKYDLILADLGVSSHQLDTQERGFSFRTNSQIDMRMDRKETVSAKDLVNGLYEDELEKIFREYGEEPFSKKIASNIVRRRKVKRIETTDELFNIIKESVPGRDSHKTRESAQRVFQALRILLNDELAALNIFLPSAFEKLNENGRMGIITFHSLEDRIVKNFVKQTKSITTKLILPTSLEIKINRRSRSAKLRLIIK
jgi:16S rRNA (cytosine1402-N4)-methyltransferase